MDTRMENLVKRILWVIEDEPLEVGIGVLGDLQV